MEGFSRTFGGGRRRGGEAVCSPRSVEASTMTPPYPLAKQWTSTHRSGRILGSPLRLLVSQALLLVVLSFLNVPHDTSLILLCAAAPASSFAFAEDAGGPALRASSRPASGGSTTTAVVEESSAIRAQVYGSIHSSAYYFTDSLVGKPTQQRQSVILDTGSSVLAVACSTCSACGTHMDAAFDVSQSETATSYPCTPSCTYCDRSGKRCGYFVSYVEGSSLKGFWLKDYVSFNPPRELSIRALFPTPSPPIAVNAPLGCHSQETHLFTTQAANGILGLEYWSQYGPEPFIAVAFRHPSVKRRVFALCLAEEGGIFSVGDDHASRHLPLEGRRADGDELKEEDITADTVIWTPMNYADRSYKVSLLGIQVGHYRLPVQSALTPPERSPNTHRAAHGGEHPPPQYRGNVESGDFPPVSFETLVDSGTTLTYLPQRLYAMVWQAIELSFENRRHLSSIRTRGSSSPHTKSPHSQEEDEADSSSDSSSSSAAADDVVSSNGTPLEDDSNANDDDSYIRDLLRAMNASELEENDGGLMVGMDDSSATTGDATTSGSATTGDATTSGSAVSDKQKTSSSIYEEVDSGEIGGRVRRLDSLTSGEPSTGFYERPRRANSGGFSAPLREFRKNQRDEAHRGDSQEVVPPIPSPVDDSNSSTQDADTYNVLEVPGEDTGESPVILHSGDRVMPYSQLPKSARLRTTQAVRLSGRRNEECWFMPNGDADLAQFPDIYLTFAESKESNQSNENASSYPHPTPGRKVRWSPSSYLYKKGSEKYRCLAIWKEESNLPNIVLGSSFFVNHDMIFDLENLRIGFADADCPATPLRERSSAGAHN